jgi:hypothetical protein
MYYAYDEYTDTYVCDADFDEDEMVALLSAKNGCPYYNPYDEYKTVRKQN